MEALIWVQDGALGAGIRESEWAMFGLLVLHTLSMGALAGTGAAIGLRVLGVAAGVPLSRMRGFFPLMKGALAVAIVSGVLLVIGYPAKALTNPVFYLKLLLVTAAMLLMRRLARGAMADAANDFGALSTSVKLTAGLALVSWALSITAGRFLAYTNTVLLLP